MIKFSTDTIYLKSNGFVYRDEKTIGYMFYNSGNSVAYINNFTLQPGQALKTFERGMIDTTRYDIRFVVNDSIPEPQYNEVQALIYNIVN